MVVGIVMVVVGVLVLISVGCWCCVGYRLYGNFKAKQHFRHQIRGYETIRRLNAEDTARTKQEMDAIADHYWRTFR